jgi:hypothetical protein
MKGFIDKVLTFTDKNSPAILTGLAIAGVVATAISAYKAGPKIEAIMAEHKMKMDLLKERSKIRASADEESEETKSERKEIIADTAKKVIPAVAPMVIFGGLTSACIISANTVSSRRIAALSAAYEIASRGLSDYKEKVEEIVPKKADEIKDAVIKKRVQEEPVPPEDHIYSTGHGDILCKDIYLKTYFRSSHDEIQKAINKVSQMVRDENWVTVADLYYELGVRHIPPIANDIGWHVDDCIEGNLPITTTTCWNDEGTVPVIGIDYEVDPFYKEGGRFRRS